jgi:hypothetical protein
VATRNSVPTASEQSVKADDKFVFDAAAEARRQIANWSTQ